MKKYVVFHSVYGYITLGLNHTNSIDWALRFSLEQAQSVIRGDELYSIVEV